MRGRARSGSSASPSARPTSRASGKCGVIRTPRIPGSTIATREDPNCHETDRVSSSAARAHRVPEAHGHWRNLDEGLSEADRDVARAAHGAAEEAGRMALARGTLLVEGR